MLKDCFLLHDANNYICEYKHNCNKYPFANRMLQMNPEAIIGYQRCIVIGVMADYALRLEEIRSCVCEK